MVHNFRHKGGRPILGGAKKLVEALCTSFAQNSTCNGRNLWFNKALRVVIETWGLEHQVHGDDAERRAVHISSEKEHFSVGSQLNFAISGDG